MKEHERQLNEAIRISRIADATERPMILGKHMGINEYQELLKFSFTLASQMFDNQDRREKPLTRLELSNMCLATAKWSLEQFTTRNPALKRQL